MICNEAAEYVSALCDGETIPADAAAHIGTCEACQERLHDYLAMGVELRRAASLEPVYEAPALEWQGQPVWWKQLWWKGWETMRVPRMAVAALLLVTLIAVGSVWTKSRVGAQSEGSVVLLKVEQEGHPDFAMNCALSLVDASKNSCTFMDMSPTSRQMVGVLFEAAGRVDGGVRILFKTAAGAIAPVSGSPGETKSFLSYYDLYKQAGRETILIPGKPLEVYVDGMPKMTLHGEWSDHLPPTLAIQHKNMDPVAGELRIQSPLLLKGKVRIGDMDGGGATADHPNQAVHIVYPCAGRYLFALSPMKDAVEGKINQSRITFQYDGQQYTLLTGAPIARTERVWVRAEPNYVSPDGPDSGLIGAQAIGEFAKEE